MITNFIKSIRKRLERAWSILILIFVLSSLYEHNEIFIQSSFELNLIYLHIIPQTYIPMIRNSQEISVNYNFYKGGFLFY